MQCPNCNHIERDELWGDPATCPSCGAIYEKALLVKQKKEQLSSPKQSSQRLRSKLKKGLKGAAQGVTEARKSSAREQSASRGGCLPVVGIVLGAAIFIFILTTALDSYHYYKEGSDNPEPALQRAQERAEKEERRKQSDREFDLKYNAQQAVKSAMHDPYSAKFRNQKGVCGEVNGKNRFGAYVGYKRYVAIRTNLAIIDDDSRDFEELWQLRCN